MNSRLMYSSVMFDTGTNSVVPGWFAFQWLNTNNPGNPVGSSARGLRAAPSPGASGRGLLDLRLDGLAGQRRDSPGSGISFHMSRKNMPSSFVKKSSVPWFEHDDGHVRVVHWTNASAPCVGSMSPRFSPVRPVAATSSSASSSSDSGTGSYGLGYESGPVAISMPSPTRRLLRSQTAWKNG